MANNLLHKQLTPIIIFVSFLATVTACGDGRRMDNPQPDGEVVEVVIPEQNNFNHQPNTSQISETPSPQTIPNDQPAEAPDPNLEETQNTTNTEQNTNL